MQSIRIVVKLPGFTLLELLVSIVISLIVMIISGYAIIFVSKQLKLIDSKRSDLANICNMHSVLTKDIDKSFSMQKTSNGIMLLMPENRRVQYFFDDMGVVRKTSNGIDTMDWRKYEILGYLNKQIASNDQYLDLVFITFTYNTKKYQLKINKSYSAEQVMQINSKQ